MRAPTFASFARVLLIASVLAAATARPALAAPGDVADGLAVWLRASSGITAANGEYVFSWEDGSGNERDAVWTLADLIDFNEFPPLFVASNPSVGGEPTVRFQNQNALAIDLSWLAGSDYTIFVVNGRDRIGVANFYIAGATFANDNNLVLGYEEPNRLRLSHFVNDLDAFVEPYLGVPVWSLDSFRFDQSSGRDIFHNGAHVASDANLTSLASNFGSTLGHFRTYGPLFWFQGELAEVVIYDRALTDAERLRVESELAARYGFPLDLEDYVPCGGPWKSHGAYMKAVAHVAATFKEFGVTVPGQQSTIVAQRASTACGQ